MEKIRFKTPKGTQDFLPAQTSVRRHVEGVVRQAFEAYGFQEVETPIFEEFALLAHRSGEEIREQMFTFVSEQVEYALRPELTAPMCRLIASGDLADLPLPYKLYYVGRCFRYGRPQAGRYREFTQAGLELMGSAASAADAEVISVAVDVLRRLDVTPFVLKVGNIGMFRDLLSHLDFDLQSRIIGHIDGIMSVREKCTTVLAKEALEFDDTEYAKNETADLYKLQERIGYHGDLEIYPQEYDSETAVRAALQRLPAVAEATYQALWQADDLIEADTADLLVQVSRVRGKKQDVASQATSLLANTGAQQAWDALLQVCDWLEAFGVAEYDVVLGVARGLDFYTGTVFEIDSPLLGAQKQVCGGGRYDRLVEEFGGPSVPATGFAFGFDRLVEVFMKSGHSVKTKPFDVFVAITEVALLRKAATIATELRRVGARCTIPLLDQDLRQQLGYAANSGADYVVILGPEEIREDKCRLRKLADRSEETIALSDLPSKVAKGALR